MAGCAALTACDSGQQGTGDTGPKRFVYTPPPKPRATKVPDGMSDWIDVLGELRAQIGEMEAKLLEVSAVHRQTAFDDLLQLNPDELGNEQLSYLWHFADKGYFTIEREIMLRILQDRGKRTLSSMEAAGNIAERAKVLAERYEAQLYEMELAIALYGKRHTEQFSIPGNLTAEQTDILRGMVHEKLDNAKEACALLDQQIQALRNPPAPPAEPAAPSEPAPAPPAEPTAPATPVEQTSA